MMRAAVLMVGVFALALAACGQAEQAPAADAPVEATVSSGLNMDADTHARMGVRAAPLAASNAARQADGFARVMDVGPLAAIESEVSTAVAAASASNEEYRRLVTLAAQDQAASARSVEAARAQAAADAARAKLAGRRIGREWGPALESMSGGERSRLLTDIASGRAALLRVDAPGANYKVTGSSVKLDKDSPAIPMKIIGQAATADARLQTTGLLGIVRGDAAAPLTAGRLLQANLELGSMEAGLLIPDSALIRADGGIFVYVKTGVDTFERREVDKGRVAPGGWFVTEGLAAIEQVVIDGAASLLAAEAGPIEAE